MYKEKFAHEDLENLMEELVFEQMDSIIASGERMLPTNEIGLQDIAAIALNNLPAKYCCSIFDKNQPRPSLLKELESYKPLVHEKVLAAIDTVNNNPHD